MKRLNANLIANIQLVGHGHHVACDAINERDLIVDSQAILRNVGGSMRTNVLALCENLPGNGAMFFPPQLGAASTIGAVDATNRTRSTCVAGEH